MVSTDALLELFQEAIDELGGRVSDALNDGRRLFARSVLPTEERISGDDVVKPGVALRCTDDAAEVRPYVYRVICRNGAILAFSGHGRSVPVASPLHEADAVRQAIHAAAAPETFHGFVQAMRESRRHRPDPELLMVAFGRRGGFDQGVVLDVLERFRKEGDLSLYAMANAVTSLARDTRDPVQRWDREVLGAKIFARILLPAPARGFQASRSCHLEPA